MQQQAVEGVTNHIANEGPAPAASFEAYVADRLGLPSSPGWSQLALGQLEQYLQQRFGLPWAAVRPVLVQLWQDFSRQQLAG